MTLKAEGTGFFRGSTGGGYGGTESRARETLGSFGNYLLEDKDRFQSTLDSLQSLEDPGEAMNLADEYGNRARRAYDAQSGVADRRLRALGLNPTRSSERKRGLGRILADVNARNKSLRGSVRRRDANRDEAFTLADIKESGIIGSLGAASNLEQSRNSAYNTARIGEAGAPYQTLGTMIGFGGGFL